MERADGLTICHVIQLVLRTEFATQKQRPALTIARRKSLCYRLQVNRNDGKFSRIALAVALIGSLVIGVVCTIAPPFAQIAVLGCYISILSGLIFSVLESHKSHEQIIDRVARQLGVVKEVWRDQELSQKYEQIIAGIAKALRIDDPLFRKLALKQLDSVAQQSEALGRGVIEFFDTEAWRLVYEEILRNVEVKSYRSVALVATDGYWQDTPGRRSLKLNYELQESKSLSIERIVIVADQLWPESEPLPSQKIADWIYDQHNHGIWIELVRMSQLELEPDLLADTGLYDNKALGVQTLDEQSRTLRFSLSFNHEDVEQASEKWNRLKMYSTSVRNILDQ